MVPVVWLPTYMCADNGPRPCGFSVGANVGTQPVEPPAPLGFQLIRSFVLPPMRSTLAPQAEQPHHAGVARVERPAPSSVFS